MAVPIFEETTNYLELELQVIVSHLMSVLETEVHSSARAASTFNCLSSLQPSTSNNHEGVLDSHRAK